jgi:hypothetical protein
MLAGPSSSYVKSGWGISKQDEGVDISDWIVSVVL